MKQSSDGKCVRNEKPTFLLFGGRKPVFCYKNRITTSIYIIYVMYQVIFCMFTFITFIITEQLYEIDPIIILILQSRN